MSSSVRESSAWPRYWLTGAATTAAFVALYLLMSWWSSGGETVQVTYFGYYYVEAPWYFGALELLPALGALYLMAFAVLVIVRSDQ